MVTLMIANVRQPIVIDSKGIRTKRHALYWSEISSLNPEKIDFSPRYKIRVKSESIDVDCIVQPDDAFIPRQYTALLGRLRPFLAAHYPKVQMKEISK
jgi:hypothetical protein